MYWEQLWIFTELKIEIKDFKWFVSYYHEKNGKKVVASDKDGEVWSSKKR